ncbi:MAG: acylphosphatase [Gemmatimonadetes bacterium]|nr:acylphosphatase [Gemmatimonadota bacterium]NIQ59030.1 acylphosphatase [Gemmatimonadota bacterium]NIU79238.1 acylphosphatase [Gammaproteobacteria bacterium]NIX48716.1 acylphosphatase [Gemmatimonadota bacterium]NIY13167.1 acylphosphatase [Gemmatimonadota bacterium]
MTERRRYRITGYVQGVGFRWWTRKTAATLDLRGTVRNAEDGSVEVEVEGPAARLDTFEDRLREGPSAAHVRGLERGEPGEDTLPTGFEIVR